LNKGQIDKLITFHEERVINLSGIKHGRLELVALTGRIGNPLRTLHYTVCGERYLYSCFFPFQSLRGTDMFGNLSHLSEGEQEWLSGVMQFVNDRFGQDNLATAWIYEQGSKEVEKESE
jgi:hypothetical protein